MQLTQEAMKTGQKVKFVTPNADELTEDGSQLPMFIVWVDRGRCMVVTDIGFGNLNPTQVVETSELIAA